MKDSLSHRERLNTILAGERPDRYAASFWRHFFHLENSAAGTSRGMIDFQKQFDWDFMKINPRADYHVEDWGLKQTWSRSEFEKHAKTAFPINRPEDWDKIEPLPLTSPALAEHLELIRLIRRGVGSDLPLFMTVFTPISIAGRMVSEQKTFLDQLRSHPNRIHAALGAITDTFKRFVVEARNAGADGIFYATTHWASGDLLSWEEYRQFGVPYDLDLIHALDVESLNLLHVCAGSNFLRQLAGLDYRARMLNWDSADPTNLPLDRAESLLPGKTLVGGVDYRGWLVRSSAAEVAVLIDELKQRHSSSRLIIGPGCAIEPTTPVANLKAIRENL